MADRWFIVPRIGEDAYEPKYNGNSGINGFTGNTISSSIVSDNFPNLTNTNPDIDMWYVVRFYGEQSALNNISSQNDTRNLSNNIQNLEALLNRKYGEEKSGDGWNSSFYMDIPTE